MSLDNTLPSAVLSAIRSGLPLMNQKWRGDFLKNANLIGPEMRGSSPVRIDRDVPARQSLGCRGLYPVGEGAGFAGGIVSAAVDGLLSAKQVVRTFADPSDESCRMNCGRAFDSTDVGIEIHASGCDFAESCSTKTSPVERLFVAVFRGEPLLTPTKASRGTAAAEPA